MLLRKVDGQCDATSALIFRYLLQNLLDLSNRKFSGNTSHKNRCPIGYGESRLPFLFSVCVSRQIENAPSALCPYFKKLFQKNTSSSTLHPRQRVSESVIVSDSDQRNLELASLFVVYCSPQPWEGPNQQRIPLRNRLSSTLPVLYLSFSDIE